MEHNNQAYTRIATRIKRRHHQETARTLQHHFDTYSFVKQTEENCLIFFAKEATEQVPKVKLVGISLENETSPNKSIFNIMFH